MSTRFFAAYNGLLTLTKAALPALDAVGAVYDGPQPTLPTDKDLVIVGCQDPFSEGPTLAVDAGQQDWVAVSPPPRPRNETFTIFNSLIAWTGSNDLPGCRTRAETNIGLIETAIANDLSLNGGLTLPGWASLSVVSFTQGQATTGSLLVVLFAVACRARI